MSSILELRGLEKHFPVRRGLLSRQTGSVRAVDGVDLDLLRGECFSLVGESGSGKTTLGRSALLLIEPTAGRILYCGQDLTALRPRQLRPLRRHFQMIFQDPFASLNPRMKVGKALAEPLAVHRLRSRSERGQRVLELLDLVGLPAEAVDRYPHEFSGGQRQRIGIARALATEPDFIVADEPISALDVSVRAQIINLLTGLRERLGLTLLFIAHDLAVVEQISDRVGVLYLGQIVESGDRGEIFSQPLHPYTVALLSAVPVPDPAGGRERILLPGEPPSPIDPPAGCRFHPRCPIAQSKCARDVPLLRGFGEGRQVACHFAGEMRWDGRIGGQMRPCADGTF